MAKLWIPALALLTITSACSNGPESTASSSASPMATTETTTSEAPTDTALNEALSAAANPTSEEAASNPHESMTADVAATFADGMIMGVVMETMNSGGYTYVKLDTAKGEVWAAGPPTELTVGQAAGLKDTFEMKNFESATLGRTFEAIQFCSSIHTAETVKTANAAAEKASEEPKVADTTAAIQRAEGGQTVGEVIAHSADFVGQEVTIRARVVKYSPAIMKKNWLHLQDGTGEEGQNDLTVTTDATAAVGDIVLMKGKLIANKDFGFGYKYDLIVEDAEITVE